MITPFHQPIANRLHGAWTAPVTPFDGDTLDLVAVVLLGEEIR